MAQKEDTPLHTVYLYLFCSLDCLGSLTGFLPIVYPYVVLPDYCVTQIFPFLTSAYVIPFCLEYSQRPCKIIFLYFKLISRYCPFIRCPIILQSYDLQILPFYMLSYNLLKKGNRTQLFKN